MLLERNYTGSPVFFTAPCALPKNLERTPSFPQNHKRAGAKIMKSVFTNTSESANCNQTGTKRKNLLPSLNSSQIFPRERSLASPVGSRKVAKMVKKLKSHRTNGETSYQVLHAAAGGKVPPRRLTSPEERVPRWRVLSASTPRLLVKLVQEKEQRWKILRQEGKGGRDEPILSPLWEEKTREPTATLRGAPLALSQAGRGHRTVETGEERYLTGPLDLAKCSPLFIGLPQNERTRSDC